MQLYRCRLSRPAHRKTSPESPATMFLYAGIILLCIASCQSAPVDEPIRVELPVYDQPQASSDVETVPAVAEHRSESARSDKSIVGNIIAHKIDELGKKIANNNNHHHHQYNHAQLAHYEGAEYLATGYFGPPPASLEGAILETEGYGSKKLTLKENLHGFVAGLLQPKPIVDTIKEEEKYGNTGDKFITAGRALVHGAEGVSNIVNSVLEVPGTIFKKITRIATEKLNNLGGKIIGL
ncbi:uncharacterized protein LOC125241405 [Leguminivora glycinivorella]|uniref:uncharacterized protein LOC125241405 n=1 Tax=Leguminivora glycinivorella TaxID=1035111 RepID=UPI00200E0215|nr:uncharacterized protein LOC125241405 [Leguminivora glycinivorella]